MSSMKLVRCVIQPRDGSLPASPRFVPLEIFGLWEFLMSSKHGFEVRESQASLWLDVEESPESAYGDHTFERVTEVSAFVYSGRDDMFTRACRYFTTDECDRLKPIFLSHYSDRGARGGPQVRERHGIWLHRTPANA